MPVIVFPAPVAFGLVNTIRNTDVPPCAIGFVTNVFVTVGSNNATTVSVAVPPVGSGALSNVAVKFGLTLLPVVVAVTMLVTVQVPPGANVMVESPIVLPPAAPVAAVTAAVDPAVQFIVTDAGVVLTRPAG